MLRLRCLRVTITSASYPPHGIGFARPHENTSVASVVQEEEDS